MTCFKGHSSSIYSLAMMAFFFSQTSDEIDVFIMGDMIWRVEIECVCVCI